ncbi:MAG TPA: hypothetical protein VES58_09020, partial [Syntrophobacteria bacterium]|nr:hypothetical protein [Syntrophobacteria bacterium]
MAEVGTVSRVAALWYSCHLTQRRIAVPVREEIQIMSGQPSPIKGPDIARQVVLPFRKSFEISVKSLRVRFFRSL